MGIAAEPTGVKARDLNPNGVLQLARQKDDELTKAYGELDLQMKRVAEERDLWRSVIEALAHLDEPGLPDITPRGR